MLNEPKWIEIEVDGEYSKQKYRGNFCIKPYLTHAERADAVRLAEMYYRGINQNEAMKMFLAVLAALKFHIVETDAKWWKDQDGLSVLDESPIYELSNKLREIQDPDFGKPKEEKKEE